MSNSRASMVSDGRPNRCPRAPAPTGTSISEYRGVPLLDIGHLRQHRHGIVRQQLDLWQWRSAGRVLHVRVYGSRAALVHGQLLGLRGVEEILEHAGRVGMRRLGEDGSRRSHERGAFLWIDDPDRALGV